MGNKLSSSKKKKYFSNSIGSTKSKKTYNFNESNLSYNENGIDNGSSSLTESMIMSGRTFHHVPNSVYWLPNDDEEMDRLIGQHFALKSLFGGNIFDGVIKMLDLENTSRTILDVGCGPGTWLMDVATEYPNSQFVGVDMCDVFPNNIRPPNVSFKLGNVLERLPFPDNTFDFVNTRLFILALKTHEWKILVKELHRVLKPGGFIQMVECGMLERGNDFIVSAGRIFKEVIISRDQEAYIAHKLQPLLESENFHVHHFKNIDVPFGHPDPLSREFLWDAINIFKAAQLAIQEPLGYNSDTYPQFLEILYKELQKKPDALWSFSICVGQK